MSIFGSSPSSRCGANEKNPNPGSALAVASVNRDPSASSMHTSACSSSCSLVNAAIIRMTRLTNSSSGPAAPGVHTCADI